jgi:hypothetical protein
MEKLAYQIGHKALVVPGVNVAAIYTQLGLLAERKKEWNNAIRNYREAFLETTYKTEKDNIEESIERVKAKKHQAKKYNYELLSN